MPENRLFATILKKDLNDQEKSVTAYANKSDSIDRSGDLIDDEAWELDNFLKNPVVPAFHMYNRPPIGKALWIKVVPGQGLRFKVQFAKTAEGLEFYELFSGGFLNAFSVGFMGKEWIDREDFEAKDIHKYMRDGNLPNRVYKKVELFEVSAVVVPDHMNALVERSAQGLIKTKGVQDFIEQIKSSKEYIELTEPTETKAKKVGFIDLEIKDIDLSQANELDMEKYQEKSEEFVEKIETTDEYHHIPVKDKSQFVDGSFKTIDITSGIKAIVGKLKSDPQGSTHVQKYLFDVDKFSLEEAKKWVKDHKKAMDENKPMTPCKEENGKCKKECPEYDDCEDEMKKSVHEDKPKKPCKQENGECKEDCEEYGTCEDEAKKSFNEVKNEDDIENKGISDDSEAGFLDIPDNGVGEVDELIEEKEVNLDEIESKNEEIIENNIEEKTIKIDISQIKEVVDELKSYINEIVEEKLKFLNENADKVNMEENSEVQEKQVDFIELKEPEKIDFEFKEKTVDVDFDPEEIKSMMKSAILTTVNDSKSMDKLVEERIRRMKGIIDFEDE